MRFMMFMQLDPQVSEDDYGPTPEIVEAMTRYNQELENAGALLAGEGLHPPHRGARVRYPGGRPVVTDGPFTEAKEIVGGYWLIEARSFDEALEWAKRIPAGDGAQVEVRQVYELSDFPQDVQEAAKL